jgi:hypothetical protein
MWLSLLVLFLGSLHAEPPLGAVKQGSYLVREDSGSFPVPVRATLRIVAPGAITVRGGDEPLASYVVRRRTKASNLELAKRSLAHPVLALAQNGNILHAVFTPRALPHGDTQVEITIPRSLLQTEIRVAEGPVNVTDLDGDLQILAASGALFVDRIAGRLTAETGGGQIQLGSLDGPSSCRTGGGSITLQRSKSSCRLVTAGGEVLVREVGGPLTAETQGGNIQVWRALSSVRAASLGGLVEINQAGGPVVADVGHGGIHVGKAAGADCRAKAGSIRLDSVSGSLHAVTGQGSILAGFHGVLEESRLSNGGGDITVFLPSNLRATVQAETRAAGAVGRIVTDFHQLIARDLFWLFTPPAQVAASLNGGGPRLVLSTAGGVIYLKKQRTE